MIARWKHTFGKKDNALFLYKKYQGKNFQTLHICTQIYANLSLKKYYKLT